MTIDELREQYYKGLEKDVRGFQETLENGHKIGFLLGSSIDDQVVIGVEENLYLPDMSQKDWIRKSYLDIMNTGKMVVAYVALSEDFKLEKSQTVFKPENPPYKKPEIKTDAAVKRVTFSLW